MPALRRHLPGVLIHRFEGPLIFANAEVFTDDVLAKVAEAHPPPDTVILDFAAVSDVDSTGDAALAELKRTLDDRGVRLLLARATGTVRGLMQADSVVEALGPENVFPTVRAAVGALEHRRWSPEGDEMVARRRPGHRGRSGSPRPAGR